MYDLSIILPVHNESEIIESVFNEIKKEVEKIGIWAEYILVENGSFDESLKILKKIEKENKDVCVLTSPKGYGSAVLAGLTKASGTNICYMPSDGQADVLILEKLFREFKKDKWDMVKVKRIKRENILRVLTSRVFAFLMFVLYNVRLLDINGSPRIIKKQLLLKLNLQSKDSFIDAEFAIKAQRLEWKIKEIPMKFINRKGGKSTRSIGTYIEFIKNILLNSGSILSL